MAFSLRQIANRFQKYNKIRLQTIMSTSNNFQKAVEDLEKNPYFEKYANKIANLQKTSPEEFLKRYEQQKIEEKRKLEETKRNERQFSAILDPKSPIKSTNLQVEDKKLKDIMKLDLIENKEPSEIKQIWEAYHLTKDVISAVIPTATYDLLSARFKKYPLFIFPLPRSQGYEFIMCQFSRNVAHFTPLINYQVHKENAPECLNMTYYTELREQKGVVLMRGELDNNTLNCAEAQCLANQLQLYYGEKQENKLLETFTNKPHQFKHMDLIKQLETFSL